MLKARSDAIHQASCIFEEDLGAVLNSVHCVVLTADKSGGEIYIDETESVLEGSMCAPQQLKASLQRLEEAVRSNQQTQIVA